MDSHPLSHNIIPSPAAKNSGTAASAPPFPYRCSLAADLLKPGGFRMAAKAEEQMSISIVELDRGVVSEAVGVVQMYRASDYSRPRKNTVFVVGIRYITKGVILSAWLA